MSNLLSKGIMKLEEELNIPWLPNKKRLSNKKLIFWTHPFFLLAESARNYDSADTMLSQIRSDIIADFRKTGDTSKAIADSFAFYQMVNEKSAITELLQKPQTHACFAIGIEKDVLEYAVAHKKPILATKGACASRILKQQIMESISRQSDVSFVLTTDMGGVCSYNMGYIFADSSSDSSSTVQYDSLSALKSSPVTVRGCYLEYCARSTHKSLLRLGFNSHLSGKGSIVNSETFNFMYGSMAKCPAVNTPIDDQLQSIQSVGGATIHADIFNYLSTRDFIAPHIQLKSDLDLVRQVDEFAISESLRKEINNLQELQHRSQRFS